MIDTYKGAFTCWADVQGAFEIDMPEPEEVLLAEYDLEYYSGEAIVIYRNGDKYGWVEGSHCSCCELEGLWDTELYDLGTLILAIGRSIKTNTYDEERTERLTLVLDALTKQKQEKWQ